jgi:hypothetical protein
VAELEQALLGEHLGVGGSGGGVDAEQGGLQVVDAHDVLAEVRLEGLPGPVVGEVIEDVGEAVVVEVEGADGLAEGGLQGEAVFLGPGLDVVEAVVALRGEEGEPAADDLAEGQLALPAVPGREVTVQQLGHLQASQGGQQHGEVIGPLHPNDARAWSTHALCLCPTTLPEKSTFLRRTGSP